ncbi:MAG: NADH-quinone oxidoreductase subunit J [Acidimicrobiia bacterium]|nr:NADH-quinone oxidoreductase subunit J [Acidimicrobiia bacterium]MDH4307173.1 NADH-quinone oxidoreductase subunit J [Acidimicrobiia bacterium]MDH5294039.1 NADH-quinone oxidoreductase subunit J [Acidimicrobiia bacterium]
MTFDVWLSDPVNWVYLAIGAAVLLCGVRVVTSQNVVHAALFLVGALAGSAALMLLLSAEFVAWTVVLVYIGAVIVLFLFGIMITRAPVVRDVGLDNKKARPVAAVVALATFAVLTYTSLLAFGNTEVARVGDPTPTETLAEGLLGRFVLPFEVVGFILLAALIGGITLARRDLSPAEEEERGAV